jgi:hypothetical protein
MSTSADPSRDLTETHSVTPASKPISEILARGADAKPPSLAVSLRTGLFICGIPRSAAFRGDAPRIEHPGGTNLRISKKIAHGTLGRAVNSEMVACLS